MDKLEHERSPCHDTSTTRQKVSANDVLERVKLFNCDAVDDGAYLEYTTLSATLATEHADLRKVYLGS